MDKILRVTGLCLAGIAAIVILIGMLLSEETKKDRKSWETRIEVFHKNGSLNRFSEDSKQNVIVDGFLKDVERYSTNLVRKESLADILFYAGVASLTIGFTCLFVGVTGGIKKRKNMLQSFE